MQFNKFERFLALTLSRFPLIKLKLKKIYQNINFFIYKKKYSIKTDYKITKISTNHAESFFGYYDKSPINATNKFVVFLSTDSNTKNLPNNKIPINIVLYDIINDVYEIIGQSNTYNWQQGAKTMWLNEFEFIYNDFDYENNNYISKIFNVAKKEEKVFQYPIYDCFKDCYALTLNFDRLSILRPDYGYTIKNKNLKIDWNNSNDGIYFLDFSSNEQKLILSIQDAINLHPKDNMNGAKHKFNHIMISPDGAKFMFLHRWFLSGRKFDRLIVADINGENASIISDDDMVSHCFWIDNENIFGFLRQHRVGDKYYSINIYSKNKVIIGGGVIDCFGDGHPNIFKKNIVFDTYPDKSRMKGLYLYNLQSNQLMKLGEFFENFDFYGETRCDLHPRFSIDGQKIFFDSVHNGSRSLYMLEGFYGNK